MRFLLVLLAAAAFAAPSPPALETVVPAPAADVSLPFLCNWGYGWEERCYRDDLDRLELGGGGAKGWRPAVRGPPRGVAAGAPGARGGVAAGAASVPEELWLTYDGTCTAPLRQTVPCDGRGFSLEAHPMYTPNWYTRREVAFGAGVGSADGWPCAGPEWVVGDVTETVADWYSGGLANDGVLLKLADEQEDYAVGGPALPSSSYADPALRPRVVVWLMT